MCPSSIVSTRTQQTIHSQHASGPHSCCPLIVLVTAPTRKLLIRDRPEAEFGQKKGGEKGEGRRIVWRRSRLGRVWCAAWCLPRAEEERIESSERMKPKGTGSNGAKRGAGSWRGRGGGSTIQGRETEFNVPLQWVTRGCNCRSGRNGASIAAMGVVRWLHRVDTDISATTDEPPPWPFAAGRPHAFPSHRSTALSVVLEAREPRMDLVRLESLDRIYLSTGVLCPTLYSSSTDDTTRSIRGYERKLPFGMLETWLGELDLVAG